jgi:hypothetical protein
MATWVDFKTDQGGRRDRRGLGAVQLAPAPDRRIRTTRALRAADPIPRRGVATAFPSVPSRNVWSCRSQSCTQAHGGRPAGNILDLVALMEGCSIREAALRLQGWSAPMPPRRQKPVEDTSTPALRKPFVFSYLFIANTREIVWEAPKLVRLPFRHFHA